MKRRDFILLGGAAFIGFYFLTRKTAMNRTATGKIKKGFSNMAMSISEYGKNLIKKFESLSLNVYPDAGGFSIGYGHYLGKTASIKNITESQANSFFVTDVANVENEMARYITAPLTQNQHDAMVSFFYNVGHKGFVNTNGTKTQILQKLNAQNYTGAASELDRWTHSKGIVNTALQNRRNGEKALFLA